jgi:hypothetical protein
LKISKSPLRLGIINYTAQYRLCRARHKRYLYAFRDSLALYQPVYLGLRTDVDTDECNVSQLKFKAEEESC